MILFFTISEEDHQTFNRLDQFLAENVKNRSRSFIKNLFKQDKVKFNEKSPIKDHKLELKKMPPVDSIIEVEIPEEIESEIKAEKIPLDIIYEDEHLCFINKPANMVIHPAPGNRHGTLANAILYHYPKTKSVGSLERPGIVHRLDKGTTGVMIFAKTQETYLGLIPLFATHQINRFYEALVIGTSMPIAGTLKSNIGRHPTNRQKMAANVRGGRTAITHYKVLKTYDLFSHLELKLETGRTHQIRVHLSSLLKSPILCDPMYGRAKSQLKKFNDRFPDLMNSYQHPLLHAKTLGFIHPITKKYIEHSVNPPDVFQGMLNAAQTI